MRSKTGRMAADGLLASVLFAAQIALIHLPNIEVVSILVILYTLTFGRRVLNILAAFTILEGLFHGFGRAHGPVETTRRTGLGVWDLVLFFRVFFWFFVLPSLSCGRHWGFIRVVDLRDPF